MFSQGDQNTPDTATSTEKAGAEKATAAEAPGVETAGPSHGPGGFADPAGSNVDIRLVSRHSRDTTRGTHGRRPGPLEDRRNGSGAEVLGAVAGAYVTDISNRAFRHPRRRSSTPTEPRCR